MGSDLLRKEKTLPTHTFISPPIPTLCRNQAAQGCLRSRSEMLVRKALETRGAGKSPETLLRQEEAAPHRKSISAKAQNTGTSWPKAHGARGALRICHRSALFRMLVRQEPGCAPAGMSAHRVTRAFLRRQLRGIFVYIRACWQTLLWSVCRKRAINFCTHVHFPEQPGGRSTLAFLSAGASLLLPASQSVLYLLSRTGWALQLSVSPWPQLVHLAVTR